MNVTLTDNELGMIEQLTYLNPSVAKEAGITGYSGFKAGRENESIGEILGAFDEKALRTLEEKGDQDIGFVSAKEWAGMIRYLQSSRMKDLVLTETMTREDGATLALCFQEKGNTQDAVVAFRGTSGGDEWVDNVQGLNETDTLCQKQALDFIESLPSSNITVTGHSKGSNKAMYVAITSDKVTRCVGYDGQGFSQEFIDKYWAEIQEKGGNITTYSLSTDYVHALLFPVPNATQIYCKGYGVANIGEHHSPNSFFVTDENGRILVDENGNPRVVPVLEDKSIIMLHQFTTFVLNNASEADKKDIIGYLSELLAMSFGGDGASKDDLIGQATKQPEKLALVVAYLAKYMEQTGHKAEDVNQMMETLGLEPLAWWLSKLLNIVIGNLTDDDDDWWIQNVILPLFKDKFGGLDLSALWAMINAKVKEINGSGGCDDATGRQGTVRDFSAGTYERLMDTIRQMESLGAGSVSSWINYSQEEWYDALGVSEAIRAINGYYERAAETNLLCQGRVDSVFDIVDATDKLSARKLQEHCQVLESIRSALQSVGDGIVVKA